MFFKCSKTILTRKEQGTIEFEEKKIKNIVIDENIDEGNNGGCMGSC